MSKQNEETKEETLLTKEEAKSEMPVVTRLSLTKAKIQKALSNVQEEAGLPSYLMELLVASILADIREAANIEMAVQFPM